MHRLACPEEPGVPLHLVQRTQGGATCFRRAREGIAYLARLAECAARLECAVHAYVLMRNHVHLLVTPGRAGAARRLMCSLGESSPLWDEAFDGSPVYAPRYLLSCMRYIEENPVRAGLAANPGEYRWSSHGANALGRADAIVVPHAAYCALGRTPETRCARYRSMFWRTEAPGAAPVTRARQQGLPYRAAKRSRGGASHAA